MISFYETATQLKLEGDPVELDELEDTLSFHPKSYFFAPSYQRFQVTNGQEGWDGYLRPLKRVDGNEAVVLRGRRDELLDICAQKEYEVDLRKLLPRPFSSLTLADVPADLVEGADLRDYQRVGVHAWLVRGIGINQVTVGGGKTIMYAAAARMIKDRFPKARIIYMTPTERLVKQVTKEMRRFLPDFQVGQYGGGKQESDAQDMVVCTVAVLNRNYSKLENRGWFRSFMAIFYDEVHHAGSKSSERVLMRIPAYFRLGASDTGKIDDEERRSKMLGHFGSFLHEVKAEPLIEQGLLAKPHIYVQPLAEYRNKFSEVPYRPVVYSTAWCLLENQWIKGRYLGPVYELDAEGNMKMRERLVVENIEGQIVRSHVQEPIIVNGRHRIEIKGEEHEVESRWCLLNRVYDEAIIRFKPRNELIVKWARYFSGLGFPTLVVCTRTLHIYLLEAALQQAVNPDLVEILFGWASPTERDETFEWFRTTPGAILITPLVKEGVSINEIRAGVIADYVADVEVANQIVGRFLRKKVDDAENFAEIVWFREDQHTGMRRGSNRLFTRFEQAYGYSVYPEPPDIGQLTQPLLPFSG